MKATILALFVAAAAAAPQNSAASETTTALTPTQSCLNECVPSDVNCQAICVGVPHPGEAQMGLVTDCVANCDQGDGSTAASEAYGRCRDSCLASYIITSGTAAPGGAYTTAPIPGVSQTAAAASASATSAGSDVEAAASSGASAASGAASSAAASGSAAASESGNGAIGSASVGAFSGLSGLVLAALALL